MWDAYQDLKMCHKRPSEVLEIDDTIAAYCLDKTVLTFGIIIENALAERVETGTGKDKKSEPRYTLSQLLDSSFTLPRPLPEPRRAPQLSGLAAMMAMAAQAGSGVKRFGYVGPAN
jgi:hypothetical protein